MHHEKSADPQQVHPSTFFRNQWLITFLVRKVIHCALIYFVIHTETEIIDEQNRGTFIINFFYIPHYLDQYLILLGVLK